MSLDAFDADVLIYAASPGHRLGQRIRLLFPNDADAVVGIGSVLLLPEILSKPLREESYKELANVGSVLARIMLHPMDYAVADVAATLATKYRLHAADAVHLGTAVNAGADRFITNNRSDFPKTITEVDVTYPEDLPDQ